MRTGQRSRGRAMARQERDDNRVRAVRRFEPLRSGRAQASWQTIIIQAQRAAGNAAVTELLTSREVAPGLLAASASPKVQRQFALPRSQTDTIKSPPAAAAAPDQSIISPNRLHRLGQQSRADGRCVGPDNRMTPVQRQPVPDEPDEIEMEGSDPHPTGLTVPKNVESVTGRWVDLWRSKKGATIGAFLSAMLAIVNSELHTLRVPPIVLDPTPSKTEGGFRRQEWRMGVNLDIDLHRPVGFGDKVSTLSATDLAVVGDTLYHEARHAEQDFTVARERARTTRVPAELAKSLEIPVSVARAAIAAGPPGADADAEKIAQWSAFEPGGRYYDYWKWNESMKGVTAETLQPIVIRSPHSLDEFTELADLINGKINALSTHWAFPYERIAEVEKLKAPKALDTDVLEELRKIAAAFDSLVLAIDDFRTAVALLRSTNDHPDKGPLLTSQASVKWLDVRMAQTQLFITQSEAYLAYPHEQDARRAGEAAAVSILNATRAARGR